MVLASASAAAKSTSDDDNNDLSAQRRALQSAYEEAVADWQRHRAQAPLASSAATNPQQQPQQLPPRPPSLERRPGGGTTVTIPVRPGADVARLVAELGAGVARCSTGSPGATTSVRQHSVSSGVARKWRWDVSTSRRGDPPTRETLAVQAYVPRQGTGAHADGEEGAGPSPPPPSWGEVVVSKSSSDGGDGAGGAFSPRELEMVCRAVHTAAASFAPVGGGKGGGGLGASDGSRLPLRGDAFLKRLFSFGAGDDNADNSKDEATRPADVLLAQAERLLRERGLPWLFGGGGFGGGGDPAAGGGHDDGDDEAADALGAWLDALFGGAGHGGGPRQFIPPPPFPPPPLFSTPAAPDDGPSSSTAMPSPNPTPKPPPPPPTHGWGSPEAQAAVQKLESLGARVYPPNRRAPAGSAPSPPLALDWGSFAGYASQKRAIEDTLLLPLMRPDVFDRLAAKTRGEGSGEAAPTARARPRAVLFEGPPGTGKTTSARALCQAGVPLVYVPVEALTSRWYGDTEKQVAAVFRAASDLGGAVLFLDELDSVAPSRERGGAGADIHTADRRLLGTLLREIDGFEIFASTPGQNRGSVVIGATNKAEDLDPALLSRFSLTLHFPLPDAETRSAILERYAAQLSASDRAHLARECEGFSGRDLRDVCEQTERRFAARIVRGEIGGGAAAAAGAGGAEEEEGDLPLPSLEDYLASARERLEAADRREGKLSGARLFRVIA
jgi:hypothetical protein